MSKIILAWLVATLALVVLSGCGGGTKTVTETVPDGFSGQAAQSPKEGASEDVRVGDFGEPQEVDLSELGDGDLTVTPTQINFSPNLPKYSQAPQHGSRWARLELEVVNNSSRQTDQSDVEYLLISGDGERVVADGTNVFEPVISCCGDGYGGNSMQSGDKASGFVAFQVPTNFVAERLRASSTISGPVVEWKISR